MDSHKPGKHTFLIVLGCILLLRPAAGYGKDSITNVIKFNPWSLIAANVSAFYERGLTPHSSAMIGVSHMNAAIYKAPLSGFGISLEYRYHPRKNTDLTPRGFYLSPFLRYQDYTFSQPVHLNDFSGKTILDVKTGFSVSQYAAGAMAGYQHIGKRGFTFDIYAGPFYNTTTFGVSASYSVISIPLWSVPVSGIWIRSGMAFGYTF